MKIIVTGLTGLVGSRVTDLLKDKYEFINFSTSVGLDVRNKEGVFSFFKSSQAPVVIHFAGKTNVDGCEKDKEGDLEILKLGEDEQEQEFKLKKTAWSANVFGTKNVANACEETGRKLIYISTDFVFDGKKEDPYEESDPSNPVNWYGRTKLEGERIVQSIRSPWTIIRISFPYRASFKKLDFVRLLIDRLSKGEHLNLVSDQIITPTFIDDLAPVFDLFIKENMSGVFHATGSESLTPFEISQKIVQIYGFDKNLIKKITREDFFKDRARRPFNLALKNDKIKKLGFNMKNIEKGLLEIRKQL